jgi:single-strand DNA-binding protein
MSDTNIVIMSGRVSKGPEIRYTASQKEVAALSIEVTKAWDGGERKEFVRIVGWGQMAQRLGEVHIGDYIIVTGEWSSRSWEKDGVKQRTTEVNAQAVAVIGSNPSGKPDIGDPGFDFD